MGEVTISVPGDCSSVISDYAVRDARRLLLWNAVSDAIRLQGDELSDVLDQRGPSDQRPDELRAAAERYVTGAEKVKALADELATAQGRGSSGNGD
jgi:hypothetical protein